MNIYPIAGIALIKMPIEVKNIHKKLGKNIILADASIEIADGDRVAIVGPTGCGKSTLLNLLSGLDAPDSGVIKIDDIIITGRRQNQLARIRADKIGFVFQSYCLQPHLTVVENVKIPSFVSKKTTSAEYDKRARHLLGLVGLKDKTHAMPAVLSGGETQRVAIARALINYPKYIFADEPTGSLDRAAAQNVLNIIKGLQERFGCTLLIVTHDPFVAGQMQRRITIDNGRLTNAD